MQRCRYSVVVLIALALALSAGAQAQKGGPMNPNILLESESLRCILGADGKTAGLVDRRTDRNVLALQAGVPFLTVRKAGRVIAATGFSFADGLLTARFAEGLSVVVKVTPRKQYLVFEIASVSDPSVDQVQFALACAADKNVSDTSGMAGDDEFAVALRALNLQINTAVWSRPAVMRATAYAQYRLVGAKFALVGAPAAQMRTALQEVVHAEDLISSPLGGPFALDAQENRGSYVFASVSEKNVDEWIALARRAGFAQIHLCGWERSLGHYEPRADLFTHGMAGLRAVVEKIHAAGLRASMHTLTGCIGVNDPWVTPVPDKRLVKDAAFTLAAPVAAADTTILTGERPADNLVTFWSDMGTGNTLQIGDEVITYTGISRTPPYGFTGCRRGAWGTGTAAHAAGAAVHHLMARYCAYVPDENSTLVGELADRIASVYNTCGFDMLYMDGAEGMPGWHQIAVMRRAIFQRLKGRVQVEASCWDPHSWLFHSRIGAWDHPKYGFKRFADLHFKELVGYYRAASLLPGQVGWWVITGPSPEFDAERAEDMEYLSAKCLGHDAPMSLQGIGPGRRPENARQEEMLTMLGRYERLRLAGYFSEAVRAKVRVPKDEFHLEQATDGAWQLRPTDAFAHRVTSLTDGSAAWNVKNRFAAQPVRLRIQALYSVAPYDSKDAVVVADFAHPEEFTKTRAAGNIPHALAAGGPPSPPISGGVVPATPAAPPVFGGLGGPASGVFTAKNGMSVRRGAWAQVGKEFSPGLNLGKGAALGVWVCGDGKGELLNLQLHNPPDHYPSWGDHYVRVDFTGWRYFEFPLRERDVEEFAEYHWPYDLHGVYRFPILRSRVGGVSLYYNDLPPGEEVKCILSPIRALPTVKAKLENPTVTIAGRRILFPVTLESGQYIEFNSPTDCRVRDERGAVLREILPRDEAPTLAAGENSVTFTCRGPEGVNARAEVTVLAQDEPLRETAPRNQIDWRWLRTEFDDPRTLRALDGEQNAWETLCRPDARRASLHVEVAVERASYPAGSPAADKPLAVEEFEDLSRFAVGPNNRYLKYVWDGEHKEVAAKPGVTSTLERATDLVKAGQSSVRFSATSTRAGSDGWCARGARFARPLDLSGYSRLGFWIHGDGAGESLKLQWRDTAGAWQDMVTPIDFEGWKYVEFPLGVGATINLTKIEYLILFFNGVPAGKTVTCCVDDVRALRETGIVRDLHLSVGGRKILFPLAVAAGQRLVYAGAGECVVFGADGTVVRRARPAGTLPALKPGPNRVEFGVGEGSAPEFEVVVRLTKEYR